MNPLFYLIQIMILIQIYDQNKLVDLITNSADADEKPDYFTKCYDDLGCIETDSRWYDEKLRPVNLRPLDRHTINTEFLLISVNKTGLNRYSDVNLIYDIMQPDHKSIDDTGFLKCKNVVLLFHDFTSNGETGWIKHLASKLLQAFEGKINVVSVDWEGGAEPPYDQAISNARIVALETSKFIKVLHNHFKVNLCNIELIGHGVGAHIAGYVGSNFNKIRKITGLDPSGPRFDGMPDVVKLNPSAAMYVEVIHTDAFESRSQGTKEALGHSDFYINNAHQQPGCDENTTYPKLVNVDRDSLHEGDILPGCSHKRAFKYFIESVHNDKCKFLGIKCKSYDDFSHGKCLSCGNHNNYRCRTFGFVTYKDSPEKQLYFLSTGEGEPFCLYEYVISIKLDADSKTRKGFFDFIFVDDENRISNASLQDTHSQERLYSSNKWNSFVYYATPPQLGLIVEAKVRWNEKKSITCVIYCKQAINVKQITIKPVQRTHGEKIESILCPVKGGNEVANGVFSTFRTCKKKKKVKKKKMNPHELIC